MTETKIFEIYWNDLTPDTQQRLREFLGGDNGNYDIFPIATLQIEEDDEK